MARQFCDLSGEQLLLMRIFGGRRIKPRIDRELNRRARTRPMFARRPVVALDDQRPAARLSARLVA